MRAKGFNWSVPEHGSPELPLVVSLPHSGTNVPKDFQSYFKEEILSTLKDTDWFVEQIYSFIPQIGGSLISAYWSRYVIDLNRSEADRENLYKDGRPQFGLIHDLEFGGSQVFKNKEKIHALLPELIEKYYRPYHEKLSQILLDLRDRFGAVLLLEGHSIASTVPAISEKPFKNFIIGNNDGKTCPDWLFDQISFGLEHLGYSVGRNDPFKGGYNTRHYARPSEGIYTIQIEMSQAIYMDEEKLVLNESNWPIVSQDIRTILEKIDFDRLVGA